MLTINFKNQVVIVTGGSSGIGEATVRLFADSGARVAIVDLHPPKESIKDNRYLQADVSDFKSVQKCVETILAEEKAVDCLINNAGISRDATIWNLTEEQWDAVLNVNLKGGGYSLGCASIHCRAFHRAAE